jgi:hypothetical protein
MVVGSIPAVNKKHLKLSFGQVKGGGPPISIRPWKSFSKVKNRHKTV